MNINVPAAFTKEEFEEVLLPKFNKRTNMHKGIIVANYKQQRNATDYTLRSGIGQDVKDNIDYVLKRIGYNKFDDLSDVAEYFRVLLEEKKYIILFAYNGTGKTRLSVEFKALGQSLDANTGIKSADTLYYNAFTEDLFIWDNDIENDAIRVIKLNSSSRFFSGLREQEMESKIRPFLHRYADFDFAINYTNWTISFNRKVSNGTTEVDISDIKISRGEENIFIWCFFLAIIQLVVDKEVSYQWVKYIYIDDPISSLDDNNVIAVASHLAGLMKKTEDIKAIVSSHHSLFYNVLCNELNTSEQLFLQKDSFLKKYLLKDTSRTPLFQHAALLKELKKAADTGELYTYHFNVLRNILEKTASFHGYKDFSACIKKPNTDEEDVVYRRIINLLSHGNYSLFEPREMIEENKNYFKEILGVFLENYKFNEKLFENSQDIEENRNE